MLGETISHYKILEKLGEGGMGVVYRAHDTKLERDVALKLLRPHLSSNPEAVKRFVLEAKAASALNHSAIGVIYEIDETEKGQTFIAMALYEGGTLRDKIDSGDITAEQAVTLASQIASGLAKAHEKGIVHRDIKPQNILLTRDGEAKIIDFGLAKLAGNTKLTRNGTTLGTAAYMSPEQAKGEEVDHRSDIFSLGTILYEMLAGETPFKGEHEAALLYGIVHEEPEEISSRCIEIDERLCGVVGRALEKEAGARYQNAGELKADLESVYTGAGSSTGIPMTTGRAVGRGRLLLFSSVVVLIIITIYALKDRFSVKPARADGLALAVIEFRDLTGSEDGQLAKTLTSLLNKGLIEPCPIRVVSEEMVQYSRRKVFGESDDPIEAHEAMEIAERSKAGYFVSGELSEIDGKRYATWSLVDVRNGDNVTGGTADGENLFIIVDSIKNRTVHALNEIKGKDYDEVIRSVTEVTTDLPEAYDEYMAGIAEKNRYNHEKAIAHLERAVALDSTFALAYLALSQVAHASGIREGPVYKYADLAVRYRSRVSPKDRIRIEIWKTNYGGGTPSFSELIETYERLLDLWPDDLATHRDLCDRSHYEWYFEEAVSYADRGLAFYPDDFTLRLYLATTLFASGQIERAVYEGRVNIELFPGNRNIWDELGLFYLAAAEPDSSESAFRRALDIDPNYYSSRQGLAFSSYCRGDIDKAIVRTQTTLEELELSRTNRRSVLVDVRSTPGLAYYYLEAGQYARALDTYEEAKRYASNDRELSRVNREGIFLLERLELGDEIMKMARRERPQTTDTLDVVTRKLAGRARAYAALDSIEALKGTLEELRGLIDYAGGYLIVMIDMLEAEAEIADGEYEKAIARLTALLGSRIGFAGGLQVFTMEKIAHIHEMAGDTQAAIDQHKALLRIYGGHALSWYNLGRLYENTGRQAEAVEHYEKFLEMWKNADKGLLQTEFARKRLEAIKGA